MAGGITSRRLDRRIRLMRVKETANVRTEVWYLQRSRIDKRYRNPDYWTRHRVNWHLIRCFVDGVMVAWVPVRFRRYSEKPLELSAMSRNYFNSYHQATVDGWGTHGLSANSRIVRLMEADMRRIEREVQRAQEYTPIMKIVAEIEKWREQSLTPSKSLQLDRASAL